MASFEELKSKGNDHFIKQEFTEAAELYTQALEMPEGNKVILFTNRSAALIGLGRFQDSLLDSDRAIELDPTWTKAYYRKAVALESLGRKRECYEVWQSAKKNCESSPWLDKQLKAASTAWKKDFRSVTVVSAEDFISRYQLLTDVRERLSTMAHFWNESSNEERLHHFKFLLSMIGGEGELSEQNQSITADMMLPMPLHNYEDLPREAILLWCTYFGSLPTEAKTALFEQIWYTLSASEKDAVLSDLKLFIAQAYEMQALATSSASLQLDDEPK